jgi:phage regulator Rha-like protein
MKMVELINNKPLTSTKVIEKYTDVKHQNILQLFRRHEKSIEKFGVIMFETWKPKKGSKGGRPETFYYLNEYQFTFFIMLMGNSEKVVQFKIDINKQFHQMRKWILEQKTMKANEAYKVTRNQAKIYRVAETEEIKKLVDYAKSNGSQSPEKYYILYSNLAKAYFDIQIKLKQGQNFREMLDIGQLTKVMWADMIIKGTITKGIEAKIPYKDIYQLAKAEILKNVELIGGKEAIPVFEQILLETNK